MSADPPPAPSCGHTVAQVAERLGVSVHTVLAWIAAGELRAVNVARRQTAKRPTWRITQAALNTFEVTRSATPAPPPTRRGKRQPDIIEFYPT